MTYLEAYIYTKHLAKKYNQNIQAFFWLIEYFTDNKINKSNFNEYKNKLFDNWLLFYDLLIQYYILNKPIARITKSFNFYCLEFEVLDNVFCPRNETELVVDYAIKYIKKYNISSIAEVGCGTGVILCSIIKNCSNIKLSYGFDISDKALFNTNNNLKKYNLTSNIIKSSCLDYLIDNNIKPECIISNPPYIDQNDPNINYETKIYDPENALFASKNGYEIYFKIIDQIKELKYDKLPLVIFEIGFNQKDLIVQYLTNINYSINNIICIKDYNKLDRIIIAWS